MSQVDQSGKRKRNFNLRLGMGGPWVGGWLFTIGFLHLSVSRTIFAIVIWPYYLGAHFGAPHP